MSEPASTLPPHKPHDSAILALNVVLALTAMAAVATLVLEYGGFDLTRQFHYALRVCQTIVVAIFVLDRLARMMLARRRFQYIRENWIDFAVMGTALAAVLIGVQFEGRIASAGALYVIITQGYILVALLLRAVSVNMRFAGSGIRPPLLLVGSFAFLALSGSGLLMLPVAVHEAYYEAWHYPEALFTAVSATCVTGLIVVDTGQHFTPFGQAVILALIQLGGLGIMLFGTVFAILVGKELSLRGSSVMGEMLGTQKVGRLGRVAAFVVLVTLCLELVGAVMLYPMFAAPHGAGGQASTAKAVWDSAFHSISSFCNAGFCLYNDNMMEGVQAGWDQPFRQRWQVLGVMAPLIVLGGLGFPVLQDCAAYTRQSLVRLKHWLRPTVGAGRHNAPRPTLSLHSKIVLATSGMLVLVGAVLLLLVEQRPGGQVGRVEFVNELTRRKRDWDSMSDAQRVGGAVFQSVTARTAGFNTMDMSQLSSAGKLVTCGLMVIGGSPASTAGGMKTVSFAVLLLAAWSVLRRRREVEVFRRGLTDQLLRKTVALVVLYAALLFVVTLLLLVTMRNETFMDVLFEACSACGTVGLSTGVTRRLTLMGKYVVTAGMFIGRLGPITLLLALTSRLKHVRYSYPQEQVIIG